VGAARDPREIIARNVSGEKNADQHRHALINDPLGITAESL